MSIRMLWWFLPVLVIGGVLLWYEPWRRVVPVTRTCVGGEEFTLPGQVVGSRADIVWNGNRVGVASVGDDGLWHGGVVPREAGQHTMWLVGLGGKLLAVGICDVAVANSQVWPTTIVGTPVPTRLAMSVSSAAPTPLPTATATPLPRMGAAAGAVALDIFPVYTDEDGIGGSTQSFVIVSNTSNLWIDTTGWTLRKQGQTDAAAFMFPSQLLGPTKTMIIWNAPEGLSEQRRLFWDGGAHWLAGDTGELRDTYGTVLVSAVAIADAEHDHAPGEDHTGE